MKQFIVDRHSGSDPIMDEVPNEKIPVYNTKLDAENDIDNLSIGQIIATKDEGSELSNPVDVVQDGNMHAVTSNAVANGLNEVMPAGTILPGMWQTAPQGFLLCDGATYQTSQYPKLASVLGATGYTFKVPDLREVVLVGVGQNTTHNIDAHDVYTLGQFRDDRMQSHTHGVIGISGGSQGHGSTTPLAAEYGSTNTGYNSGRRDNTTHGKQFGVNYIIKY